jgi:integrase
LWGVYKLPRYPYFLPTLRLHGAKSTGKGLRGICVRVRITEALIRQIPLSPRTVFIRDDRLVGFALRVTPAGAKSFIAESRVAGRMRRFTIGAASRFTADEARTAARALLAEMAQGKDPQAKRRAARARSDTLGATLEDYIAAKDIRASTAGKYRAQLRRHLFDWLDKPIADITPQMVRLRYEALLKRSVSEANGTMRVLRAVCRRAVAVLPARPDGSPMMRGTPTDALARGWKPLARKTTRLDPEDLPAWWRGVDSVESEDSRRALRGLLVTGLRVNELLRLAWADVDLPRRRLAIQDSKTGAFEKFIGPEFAGWLACWRGDAKPDALVFNVRDLRAALQSTVRHGGKRVAPHDLRRTFLTFGEQCGAPIVCLKRLVNHSTNGDVTVGYVHPSDDGLRHWAAVIERALLRAAQEETAIARLRAAP